LNADRTVPMQLKRRVANGNLGVKTGRGWNTYTPEQLTALTDSLTRELIRQLQRDRGAAAAGVERPPATFSD
jgi:3-hydroxyacyl-CoA dehydrogenase